STPQLLALGFSTPSAGKACGASPLRASLRSVLPSVPHRNYWHWGSAPPPQAKPAEPPRSEPRFARSYHRFHTAITGTGVQHPLRRQSLRSLPAQSLASLGPTIGSTPQLLALGFSTPSAGKACGASPLTLASLGICRWVQHPFSSGKATGASLRSLCR